jgi:uncharacterized delta-60 repeat protein
MKKYFLISLYIFFINTLHCQTYQLSQGFGINGIVITENITEPIKTISTPDSKILTTGFHLQNNPNPNLITHSFLLQLNQDGTVDQYFGNNGLLITNIDYKDTPHDLTFQNDGKILLGGSYTVQNPQLGVFPNSPFIARYNSNGSQDISFATNGIFKIPYFNTLTSTNLCSIVTLNDGGIILGISGNNNSNFFGAIVKLDSNGITDNTFGTNGILTFNDPNFRFNLLKVLLTENNNLLLCGYDGTILSNPKTAVIKLNIDGSYNSSFANNGKLITDIIAPSSSFEFFNKIIKTPDNNFIAGGKSGSNHSMIKFDLNGQLITTFGNNGIFQNFNNISDFQIQNDGTIYLGGIELQNNEPIFKIICLNQNGTINTSFNNNGFFYLDATNQRDNLKSFIVDNSQSIIMSGWTGTTDNYKVIHAKIESENLSKENFSSYRVKLIPNPFNDTIYVDESSNVKLLEFYDYLGKKIDFAMRDNFSIINTEHLKSGFYLCKITFSDNTTTIRKLVKQ